MSDLEHKNTTKDLALGFFNSTPDFIVVIGVDGVIKYVNPAFLSVLGYNEEESVGKPILDFVFEADRERTSQQIERVASGQAIFAFEIRIVCKNETLRFVSWAGFFNHEEQLLYGIGRDVTEMREQEKLQRDLISIASHELRTPLTAIKSSLELIADGVAGELPENVLSLIRMSNDSCDHLLRVVNNILDMDKIENGKMELNSEPVVLADVIKSCVAANIHYGASCGAIFSIKAILPNVIVTMDKDRITQVMDNLLSNAAKYGSGADIIEVAMELQPENMVRVSIKDHGEGIDKSIESHLFQKFIQGKQPTKILGTGKIHGTGLGLNICKSLIELYGGKIGFFSQKGKGTTFYFDLPMFQGPNARVSHETPKTEAAPTYRILVCEDEPLVRNVLVQLLTRKEFIVESVDNAAEARKLLTEKHFDAMTVDLMMPEENGAEFLKKLRQDNKYADFPVIVISAVASSLRESPEGQALGAFDFLDKPIEKNRFNQTVANLKATIDERTLQHNHSL